MPSSGGERNKQEHTIALPGISLPKGGGAMFAMKQKYRLFRRSNGIYFFQDRFTGKQESLRTRDKSEAQRLVHAHNEAHQQPFLNLQIAKAYLAGSDRCQHQYPQRPRHLDYRAERCQAALRLQEQCPPVFQLP